ncbi:MAG: MFS transporter [Candidatus Bathyarchaeia archaeon]
MTEKRLYLLLLSAFSFFMGNTIIGPTLPLYISHLGASRFEVGLLMGISSGAVVVGRIPFGILSEGLEKWLIIIFSLSVQFVSLLFYFYATSVGWLYFIRLLHAFAPMSFNPIAISLASDLSPPDKRGTVMVIYLTSVAVAMIVGPFINGLLIEAL